MRVTRVGLQAIAALSTLTVAAQSFAAGGGDNKNIVDIQLTPLIVTVVIFVCLLLVLRKFAWTPILKGLKAREDAIRNSIEAAAKAKSDAEKTTRDLETKMAEVQAEASKQLMQAKADAVKLAESIKAQAEAESAAIKERTLRDIEAAKQQALTEINTRAADVGVAVARKILRREVNVTDQAKLVEESLAQLGTTKV